jgi:hypothetical protein
MDTTWNSFVPQCCPVTQLSEFADDPYNDDLTVQIDGTHTPEGPHQHR